MEATAGKKAAARAVPERMQRPKRETNAGELGTRKGGRRGKKKATTEKDGEQAGEAGQNRSKSHGTRCDGKDADRATSKRVTKGDTVDGGRPQRGERRGAAKPKEQASWMQLGKEPNEGAGQQSTK